MAFASQFEYIIEAEREAAERLRVIFVFDFLMNLKNLTLLPVVLRSWNCVTFFDKEYVQKYFKIIFGLLKYSKMLLN